MRGRVRERGDFSKNHDYGYRRSRERGFFVRERRQALPSRGRSRHVLRRPADLRARVPSNAPPKSNVYPHHHVNLSSRRVEFKGRNDGASWRVRDSNRQEDTSRPLPSKPPLQKTFRDLFSDQDVAEGGDWKEVKKRKVNRKERARSPIIKNPCFRCGLGGHFRYNCPKKLNMRCYGCNSATHLIKDCLVIQRPEIAKVELESVYNITSKVISLYKFAIFRAKGPVNIHTLRSGMVGKFWEGSWQGKIIPFERNSFLVSFPNECRRDMAVLAGKVNFGEFSGTFYVWNENYGAMKVMRPVIVWITIFGLPLHFWGKEEIKSITDCFGKLHKLGDNFYKKERADTLKVLVEVDDISLVPKTMHCSYKAISDERVRIYPIELCPAMACLPVSQWNEETYNSYAEEIGEGDRVEQGWTGDGLPSRTSERQAESQEKDEEEAGFQGDDRYKAGLGERNVGERIAGMEGAGERANQLNEAVVQEGGTRIRAENDRMPTFSAGELARRRKGKEIQIQTAGGPGGPRMGGGSAGLWIGGGFRGPTNFSSGSDSCDPLMHGTDRAMGQVSGDDADSGIGPGGNKGKGMDEPIIISDGSDEDKDMGGEGRGIKEAAMTFSVKSENVGDTFRAVEPIVKEREVEEVGGGGHVEREGDRNQVATGGSKASTGSVPPGYQRLQPIKPKGAPGVSSPFGKLQKGGFKYLKRSASTASSGAKSTQSQPKKTRPLSSMPDKEIAEVAREVGVVEKLSEQQIARLKSRERDQASS